uniref:SGF29 C-terminal domain-containing protein n=1 Tax=Vannella robusta TaxID=1487602 RepID=A0A7S4I4G0_9EUKA
MVLERNQHVAACVPYTKKKNEWIVAKIERWEPDNNCFIVKDLFPDKRKKVHSWQVAPENVIRFPSLDSDVFGPGNRVLSLWRVDNEEWSSMFYRATVVEVPKTQVGENQTLRLCFEGDNEIHEVPRSKAIKFEKRSTRAAQSGTGAIVDSQRVRKTPLEALEEPPFKRAKSSSDSSPSEGESPVPFHGGLYGGPCSVLEKKMRNYRSILLQRYNNAHQATLLNV